MAVPQKQNRANIKDELERKNAEMARQQELAERSKPKDSDEDLGEIDKTSADSFPSSDPPATP